jgi:hypothetical protein
MHMYVIFFTDLNSSPNIQTNGHKFRMISRKMFIKNSKRFFIFTLQWCIFFGDVTDGKSRRMANQQFTVVYSDPLNHEVEGNFLRKKAE